MNSTTQQLGSESIVKLLIKYSIPTLIGTLVTSLYNIVDRAFIGHGVGALAISGLALTMPIMNIISAFGMLVGQGSAAQISIFLGKGDLKSAERVICNALWLSIVLVLSSSLITLAFIEPILLKFGGSYDTIPYAIEYLRIVMPGQVLTSISFGFNNMMRASGYPVKAMCTMLIGAVINVVFTPLFIFVFHLGIAGAAWATVLGMAVSTVWVIWHFLQESSTVHFKRSAFHLDWKIVGAIISIGLSPFFIQMATSAVNVFMNTSLQYYGGDFAVGAHGIFNSLGMLVIMAVVGIANGMQPIVGYNYGAKLNDRVLKTVKYVIVIATVITTTGALVAVFFPQLFVGIFTRDAELAAISIHGMRLCFLLFPVVGTQVVATNFFQYIGKAKVSIFLSLSRQLIFLLPLVYLFGYWWGLDGIWCSLPVSDFLAFVVAAALLVRQCRKLKKLPIKTA